MEKKLCPKCGKILKNNFCRDCFINKIENAENAINNAQKLQDKICNEMKATKFQVLKKLVIIAGTIFLTGAIIGYWFSRWRFV